MVVTPLKEYNFIIFEFRQSFSTKTEVPIIFSFTYRQSADNLLYSPCSDSGSCKVCLAITFAMPNQAILMFSMLSWIKTKKPYNHRTVISSTNIRLFASPFHGESSAEDND